MGGHHSGDLHHKKVSAHSFAHIICPPMNSIMAWLETVIWQTFQAIVAFVVLINVWNTNAGLLLALMLFGFVLNLVFWLWTIFWDGHKVLQLRKIMHSSEHMKEELLRWMYWACDQYHFFNNMMAYIVFIIFFGVWVGINNGLTNYQPLPLAPTPEQITNMVIHKFFAAFLISMAGLNWRHLWDTKKWRELEIIKDYKHITKTLAAPLSSYSKK